MPQQKSAKKRVKIGLRNQERNRAARSTVRTRLKQTTEAKQNDRDAALRELEEETSVMAKLITIEAESEGLIRYDIPHELVPHIWKGRYRGQEQKWYLMRFHGLDNQIDLDTQTPEFTAWQWMAPDQLVDNIVPFKREVYQQVLAEFGPRL